MDCELNVEKSVLAPDMDCGLESEENHMPEFHHIKIEDIKQEQLEQDDVGFDCDAELGRYEVLNQDWIKAEGDEICNIMEPHQSMEVCDSTDPSGSKMILCILCQAKCDPEESMVCRSCQKNNERQGGMEVAPECLLNDEAEVRQIHNGSSCEKDMNRETEKNREGVKESDNSKFPTGVFVACDLFTCKICPFKSTDISEVQSHIIKQHETANKPTRDCTKRTAYRKKKDNKEKGTDVEELKLLASLLDDYNTYCCYICPFKNINQKAMRNHLRAHTSGGKFFKCIYCPYITTSSTNVNKHMGTHSTKKLYNCTICSFKSIDSDRLKVHLTTHDYSSGSKKAVNCEKKSSKDVEKHEDGQNSADGSESQNDRTNTPSGSEQYECNICSFTTTRPSALEKHMDTHFYLISAKKTLNNKEGKLVKVRGNPHVLATVIDGHKTFCCQLCPYKTRNSTHMKDHTNTHTGYKKYQCSLCPYTCSRSSSLKIHMHNHTGIKPYRCSVCSHTSSRAGDLKRHMATHDKTKRQSDADMERKRDDKSARIVFDGEKTICCQICDFKTANISDMLNHSYTHRGHKVLKCTVCSFRTVDESHLKEHMTTHES